MRWFAEHQPTTAIIDTIRSLLADQPVGGDIWIAIAWCIGTLVGAYCIAVAIYRRKVQ